MTNDTTMYVNQTPEGGWRISGTRVSLDSVVRAYWEGRQPEVIAVDFPALSLEQIHGAIAYYLRNRAEFDRYLESQDELWEKFQQESSKQHGPLMRRIRGESLTKVGA